VLACDPQWALGMTNSNAAIVGRTPAYNDLEIASLVHRALAAVQGVGRFGDRKVFIASLWAMMLHIEAQTGSTLAYRASLEHFKAWLLRSLRLTRDGRATIRSDAFAPAQTVRAAGDRLSSHPGRPLARSATRPSTAPAPCRAAADRCGPRRCRAA